MKFLLPALAVAILASCSNQTDRATVDPVVIQSQPIARPALNLPDVDQFVAEDVTWMVVTPSNVEQIFADMVARGDDPVIFGVTEEGFDNIAINSSQSLRVILQQQAVIDGYREYYISADGQIQAHNAAIN